MPSVPDSPRRAREGTVATRSVPGTSVGATRKCGTFTANDRPRPVDSRAWSTPSSGRPEEMTPTWRAFVYASRVSPSRAARLAAHTQQT